MSHTEVSFMPAAALSLEALADLFTRSFEEYFYPGVTTAEILAMRLRVEQIDLWHSPVLLVDGVPSGVALLAIRGEQSWCGGFGVVLAQRGKGLAHRLANELVAHARRAGMRSFKLEVLTRNERALKVYQQAGLVITRTLDVLNWQANEARPATVQLTAAPPPELLAHFSALHPAPAAWQRDLPSLLVQPLQGFALIQAGGLQAYALLKPQAQGMRIVDIGGYTAESVQLLLNGLQANATSLVSVNEPTASPLTQAFAAAQFTLSDQQYEMEMTL